MPPQDPLKVKLAQIEQTIANLKDLLFGQALEEALKPLLAEQAALKAQLIGQGVITQDSELSAGDRGVSGSAAAGDIITGDDNITVYAEQGATVVIGEAPVKMTAVDQRSALGRYLRHMISRNRYLHKAFGPADGWSISNSIRSISPCGRPGSGRWLKKKHF
jgi:hypothetical protein